MKKIIDFFSAKIRYFSKDIWQAYYYNQHKKQSKLILVYKAVFLSIQLFSKGRINTKASALTYYSLFALVPLLAFIFGIARGFGYESVILKFMLSKFNSQGNIAERIYEMTKSYLDHAQGGLFVGIGICVLLYSVIKVCYQIELSFNEIWKIEKNRTLVRRFTDYISLVFLIPILITLTSSLSFYFKFYLVSITDYVYVVSPAFDFILSVFPFFITWLVFTLVYMIMPNTKVKFKHAAVAGVVASIGFQGFRYLYFWGQSFATNYNAVYGSFAVLPLLLLFIQITWFIVLFGAQISYVSQNVRTFDFKNDVQDISFHYYEFIVLVIAKIVIRRFEEGKDPYSAEQLSDEYCMPLPLVTFIMKKMCDANVFTETYNTKDVGTPCFQPAFDVNKMSVSKVFEMLNKTGVNSFGVETNESFRPIWEYVNSMRLDFEQQHGSVLIKDIQIGKPDDAI
ncbi:MAG: YihY/virulence factor BrkB family protein [Paludibacteraceae bacterium]|nr:YihY/virulence factor BrkB family protein [Paludibacteraceae bacterium]MBP5456547.1 YihY/virulence factor BrkB family protein [Paludibacteraceae bacterium]MBR4840008.1 YihY/virulence factor BrkB family protein [Paludibacteraceae bacterium]